jgi:hypothetical protein
MANASPDPEGFARMVFVLTVLGVGAFAAWALLVMY